MSIVGDNLTIQLCNTSSQASLNPNDLLASFYFDIVGPGNTRPTLNYVSSNGDVWLADRDNPDTLVGPNANLRALVAGDHTWQFKTMNASVTPFAGFGIGTVGNNNLTPNNFNGNITGGINYSIYAGDITTSNLNGQLLVKDCATFVFSGLTGFNESHISPIVHFGLGTAPDSLLTTIPAPGAAMLLGLGGLAAARRRR